ncbi:GNAT family N-acetyltransferase [Streptomyces prunicolor]|uniref:GNAT family N-acetyltransferase n=1 Tax=Streptomyces prunicolor TaxID=67348 RepID=UPI0037DA13DD
MSPCRRSRARCTGGRSVPVRVCCSWPPCCSSGAFRGALSGRRGRGTRGRGRRSRGRRNGAAGVTGCRGATSRLSADIQSVFAMPEQRGRGIGSALVAAASEHAARLGSLRVTVHSGRRAEPVYERLGFESSRRLLSRPPD